MKEQVEVDHDIFICYSSKDRNYADKVCKALEANHIKCWIAPRNIIAGSKYAESVLAAIDHCQIVVFILSAHSDTSPHTASEIEAAFSKRKKIIPFRIENIEPSGDTLLFIKAIHWLDAFTPPIKTHLKELAETIKAQLPARVPPKPPKPPSPIDSTESQDLPKPEGFESTHRARTPATRMKILVSILSVIAVVISFFLFKPVKHSPADQTGLITPTDTMATEQQQTAPKDSARLAEAQRAFDQGEYDQCIKIVNEIPQSDANHPAAESLRTLAQKAKEKKSIGQQTEEAKKQTLKQAQEAYEKENYDQAVKLLNEENRAAQIKADLERAQQEYDQGNYDQSIALLQKILASDPQNAAASSLLNLARVELEKNISEQKKKEAISERLNQAQQAFDRKDFDQCLSLTRQVLELDTLCSEADKLLYAANLESAPQQMNRMVQHYRDAWNTQLPCEFCRQYYSHELQQEQAAALEQLFDEYENFQAAIGEEIKVKYDAHENDQVEVNFTIMLTADLRGQKAKKVLFDGKHTWDVELQAGYWKIIGISAQSSGAQ